MSLFRKECFFIPILLLCIVFTAGLLVYDDYGASADEHIQIEGSHIHWRILMKLIGKEYPPEFDDLPDLRDFQNRYYGYASMIPVVIIEAIRHFTLDTSEIIKLRHLFCFFAYFLGTCLFALLMQERFQNQYLTVSSVLLLVLQPRLFGDIFYNDRDLMLISWMMIFIFFFEKMYRNNRWYWILLTGFSLSMEINTRIFAVVLLIFPLLIIIVNKKAYKSVFVMLMVTFVILFLISPIAWGNPITFFKDAAYHLLTQQRSQDTGNIARLLFMNEKYYEQDVPFYYLPVYIIISTPVTLLFFSFVGTIFTLYRFFVIRDCEEIHIEVGMVMILFTVIVGVMVIRPVFYNGWRHFYFLSVPILFLSVRGLSIMYDSQKKIPICVTGIIIVVYTLINVIWIARAHPYQIIYLNPLVRAKAAGKFDRDYWIISTTECMDFMDEYCQEGEIRIYDIDGFIGFAGIGLPQSVRERFVPIPWTASDEPVPFILYNYTNKQGNERDFPGYHLIYSIERDGMKIAEIFAYDSTSSIGDDSKMQKN